MGFLRASLGFFVLSLVCVICGVTMEAAALPLLRLLLVIFLGLAVFTFVIGILTETKGPRQ